MNQHTQTELLVSNIQCSHLNAKCSSWERNVYYFEQKMNPDKYCSSRKSDGSLRQICQTFTNCRRDWDNASGNQMLHLYRFYASITQLETKTSSTSYVKPCRTLVFLSSSAVQRIVHDFVCTGFSQQGSLGGFGLTFCNREYDPRVRTFGQLTTTQVFLPSYHL